jgi:PmbA protein
VVKTDSTTALRFDGGVVREADYCETTGANLRLVVDGRIGGAGTTTADAQALVEAAVASARVGDEHKLFYPEPAPTAEPQVHNAAAAAADLEDLQLSGMLIGDELADDRTTIDLHLERSVGSVHLANTRGVDKYYDVTGVALDVTATRTYGERSVTARAWWGGAGLLTDDDVASLVHDLQQRLAWGETAATVADGPAVVCLTPRAAASVLVPLRRALRGASLHYGVSPLKDKMGTRVVDERITLVDDPLLDGRSGSKPIDDEGVVCRRLPLIEAGIFRAGIYDLETAALAGVPATGHGRRTTFGKPQAAFTNLEVLPGEDGWDRLLEATGDGLVVDGFHGVRRGFATGGAVRAPASLAYRVSGGKIVGHTPGVRLSGNVFRCLERVLALGSERPWLGSMAVPAIVVEGFHVAS